MTRHGDNNDRPDTDTRFQIKRHDQQNNAERRDAYRQYIDTSRVKRRWATRCHAIQRRHPDAKRRDAYHPGDTRVRITRRLASGRHSTQGQISDAVRRDHRRWEDELGQPRDTTLVTEFH